MRCTVFPETYMCRMVAILSTSGHQIFQEIPSASSLYAKTKMIVLFYITYMNAFNCFAASCTYLLNQAFCSENLTYSSLIKTAICLRMKFKHAIACCRQQLRTMDPKTRAVFDSLLQAVAALWQAMASYGSPVAAEGQTQSETATNHPRRAD